MEVEGEGEGEVEGGGEGEVERKFSTSFVHLVPIPTIHYCIACTRVTVRFSRYGAYRMVCL